MNIIEATYIINTPMFLGSVDSDKPELRPPSIIGVLRFWYRALALAEFDGYENKVEKAERVIFGYTKGNDACKALYSIKIKSDLEYEGKDEKESRLGIVYLGYGLLRYNKHSKANFYTRNHFPIDELINIVFIKNNGIKPGIKNNELEITEKLLLDSLKCLGIFGGLGSRTRRGFGSLTLMSLKRNKVDVLKSSIGDTRENLAKEIKGLLAKASSYDKKIDEIKYTAFSKNTQIVITKEFTDPMNLLNEIGKEMVRYRSYGRGGKRFDGKTPTKLAINDHDLMYDYVNYNKLDKHPKRIVFGLPHNYSLSKKNKKNKRTSISVNSGDARRASPLFIHVHKLTDNSYVGVLMFIPSKFTKDGYVSIKVEQKDWTKKNIETKVDYNILSGFLKQIEQNLSGKLIVGDREVKTYE